MAFFNELTRGLKATGQTVAQKTKEISETVQVKAQISTEKESITRLYASIGKQIFESGCEDAEKKYFTEFDAIRKAMAKIEELEAALSEKDGCIFCPQCGARIDKNSKFCMKCGAAVDAAKEKEDVVDPVEDEPKAEEAAVEEECFVESEVVVTEAEVVEG